MGLLSEEQKKTTFTAKIDQKTADELNKLRSQLQGTGVVLDLDYLTDSWLRRTINKARKELQEKNNRP